MGVGTTLTTKERATTPVFARYRPPVAGPKTEPADTIALSSPQALSGSQANIVTVSVGARPLSATVSTSLGANVKAK